MLAVVLALGAVSGFSPAMQPQLARPAVQSSEVCMMAENRYGFGRKTDRRDRPLSPGSNYPTTKNIQTQRNGFGTFVQKFQTTTGKSKYGVPIFLPNGNVNPAYLAAERKEMQAQSKLNIKATEAKRKKLVANKQFELADYIKKAIGSVGSGKEDYQSGK